MKHSSQIAGLSACFFIGALAGCTSTEVASTSEPVDIDRVIAFLPEGISASYDDVSFDPRTGLTRVTDLRLMSDESDETGVVVEELLLSGFNEQLLEERIAGTNFDESGVLFDYLHARNSSLFGVESVFNELNNSYLDAVGDLAEGLVDDPALTEEFEAQKDSITEFDFRIADVTFDDLMLLAYVPPEAVKFDASAEGDLEVDEELETGLGFIQQYFAGSRSIGAKQASMTGIGYDLAMITEGQPLDMEFRMESIELTNWAGGDLERGSATGVVFDMVGPADEEDEDFPFEQVEISGGIGNYTFEGIRLDEAYGWVAKGQLPPETETDLMSLGTYVMEDYTMDMFGASFFNLERATVDMSGFHWLVPTKLKLSYEDMTYDFGSLLSTVASVDPDIQNDGDMAQILSVLTTLEDYGLSAPTFDMDMVWTWDAEGGPLNLGLAFDMDDYGSLSLNMDGSIADFASLYAAFSGSEEGGLDPQTLLAATSSLSNLSIEMSDDGGIDNILSLMIDIAKANPDMEELQMLTNFEPDGLKNMAVGMIALASPQITAEFPEAQSYITALTNYLSQGGTIRVAVDPETPLGIATAAQFQSADGPSEMAELLSLVVEHTPPAAE